METLESNKGVPVEKVIKLEDALRLKTMELVALQRDIERANKEHVMALERDKNEISGLKIDLQSSKDQIEKLKNLSDG